MEKTAAAAILPQVPDSVNADRMTDEQIRSKLQRGYRDFEAGRVRDAADVWNIESRVKRL